MDSQWWATEWDRSDYDRHRYRTTVNRYIALLGNKCAQCKSTEGLEFDHVDPESKSFNIREKCLQGDRVILPELAKCQLLCSRCYDEKNLEPKRAPHGGGSVGRRNCNCEPCRLKRNEYQRERRRKAKAERTIQVDMM